MGCWNGTCSFTNMPIACGEKVMVLFAERVAFHQGSSCYDPSNILSPITMPMMAEYNDYGGAENFEEDVMSDFNKEVIKNYLVKHEDKHNYDYSEGIDLEKFTQYVERSFHQQSDIDGVVLLLIKADVYIEMCEYFETVKGERTPSDHFEESIKSFEMFKDPEKQKLVESCPEIFYRMFRIFRFYSFEKHLGKFLFDLREDENRYNEMLFYTKHYFLYDSLLSHMRKTYDPASGAGTQYFGGEHYSKFYEVCLKESKKIEKENEDY